jgi:DNA-binding ferritin-like protein
MTEAPAYSPVNSSPDARNLVAAALDNVLQDISQLLIATREAHSKMSDELSFSLKSLAGYQHTQLAQTLSVIAKTMREKTSGLSFVCDEQYKREFQNLGPEDCSVVIARLIVLHEVSARHLRNAIELAHAESDEKTNDLLVECINFYVKAAWMLRALLH